MKLSRKSLIYNRVKKKNIVLNNMLAGAEKPIQANISAVDEIAFIVNKISAGP